MKHSRRLLLSWIIAMGLVGFGVLANWYLVFVVAAQPTSPVVVNPYQTLYEDLLYPSVRITTADGIGSGVIIGVNEFISSRAHESTNELMNSSTNELFILTAAHVVGDEALVSVELFNSTESLPAFVVATDTGKDLALLRLKPNTQNTGCQIRLKPNTQNTGCQTLVWVAKLAPRSYVPYIFTPVWVIGCSLGLPTRPSEGIISAISNDAWEISAPILPGNSGGGVFDGRTHELIGIAVWVRVYQGQLITTMAGIVPINQIYEFLDSRR
jgi:S1-C subfamily serine protease